MPDLLAVRFSKVGFYDTRIDGLGYYLTRDGEAKNSLIITGNGGGKTTQIHLLFSLFLPQKWDLMTYRDNTGRRFEYYFEENEIAFIATEWSIPNSQVLLGGKARTRVIGRLTQFTNREKYEHETYFFSFIADDSLGIDDLPITSSIPHRVKSYCRTVSEAKKYLKETFDKPGREFFGPSNKMEEWQNHLRSMGFNIDVFRLMQMFTMSEGDPAAFLNRYCNNEAVLGLITREVMDKASTSRLRDMLVQHRESIRLAPVTRAQIAAYNTLLALFSEMEPTAQRLLAAEEEHRKAVAEVGVVAGRIKATLDRASERASFLSLVQNEERSVLVIEQKGLGELEAELRGVRERLAALAVIEARERVREAGAIHKEKEALAVALRALVDQVEVLAAQGARDDLTRRLDALAEPTRSLADEVAMAEFLLAEYLEKDLLKATDALNRFEREQQDADGRKSELSAEKQGLQSNLAGMKREEELLKGVEADRERSLAGLAEYRRPQTEEKAPNDLLTLLEQTRVDLGLRKEAAQQDQAEVKSRLASVALLLKAEHEKLERHQAEAVTVEAQYEEYLKRQSALSELTGIANFFKLDPPDLFLHGLESRLKTHVMECERDVRVLEGEISAREERIRAIERNGGLLPSSRDVETVMEALRAEKLDAYTYWQVFSQQNRSAEESAEALRRDPLRIGGVAVSGPNAVVKAREILENCSVLAPVAVTDYTSEIRQQEHDGFLVLPDAAVAIDRRKAQEFCATAQREITEREGRIVRLNAAREAAQEARDALLGFLGTFNNATEELLKEEKGRIRKAMSACEAELVRLDEEEISLKSQAGAKEEFLRDLRSAMENLQPGIEAVRNHIARFEEGREDRLKKLLQLSLESGDTELTLEKLSEHLRIAEARERAAREAVINGGNAAAAVRSALGKLGGVRKPPTEAFRLQATSTESAQALHEEKGRALESANANEEFINAKAQCEAAQKHYQALQGRWDRQHGRVPRNHLELARATAVAGEVPTEEDHLWAAEARDEAHREQLRAEHARDTRVQDESQLKKAHFNLPVTACELELPEAQEKRDLLLVSTTELTATVERRSHEMEARAKEIDLLRTQIAVFRALATDLSVPEGENVHPPFATAEEAENSLTVTRNIEKTARKTVESLAASLQHLNIRLAELLDSDACQSIAAMGSLIKEEQRRCEGVLKEDIGGFLSRISNAVESLKFELGQHEENERKVIDQVVLDVKKAHSYLKKLESRSKVPSLGGIWAEWSGRSFIRFRSKVEIDSELSRQVIADTVATISQLSGDLPPGDQIIHTALSHVLDRKYVIETLKPDSSPTTSYRSIEHATGLNSWSGGERLSGAVLFYLSVCNLLTVEGQTDNVMLLDNPFGSCTNIDFIRLVLALARQYGVQVVAFTPTEIEDIRRLFTLNIMIRKGGVDGIVKRTGRPLVKYEKTIYNEGESTILEMTREAPIHVQA